MNKQKNLESSCILQCTSSGKRQVKTSQDDTKPCQLQLWVKKVSSCCINFQHELTCQMLTNQCIKGGRIAWPTRVSTVFPTCKNWLNFHIRGWDWNLNFISAARKHNLFPVHLKNWTWACDHLKTRILSADTLKNTRPRWVDLWVRHKVRWRWSADTLFWQLSIDRNINVHIRLHLGS